MSIFDDPKPVPEPAPAGPEVVPPVESVPVVETPAVEPVPVEQPVVESPVVAPVEPATPAETVAPEPQEPPALPAPTVIDDPVPQVVDPVAEVPDSPAVVPPYKRFTVTANDSNGTFEAIALDGADAIAQCVQAWNLKPGYTFTVSEE